MSEHLKLITAGDHIGSLVGSHIPSKESLDELKMCKRCDHLLSRHRIRQTHTIPNPARHTVIYCERCQDSCHTLGIETDERPPQPVQSYWVKDRLRRAGFGG